MKVWSREQNEYTHSVEKLLMIMCKTYIHIIKFWNYEVRRLLEGGAS